MSLKNVVVVGARGRVGGLIVRQLEVEGLNLAAAPNRGDAWAFPADGVDVVVEFAGPSGLENALDWCTINQKPLVSGSTGLTAFGRRRLENLARRVPVFYAANFSLGMAAMSHALGAFGVLRNWDFQVDETHHRAKRDRPSGTALGLNETLAGVLGRTMPTPNSTRGGTVPGLHQVWAMGVDEYLCFQHVALDRRVFAIGAVRAARWLFDKKTPGLYKMDDLTSTPNI